MAGHDPHDQTPETPPGRQPTEEPRQEQPAAQIRPRERAPLRPVQASRDLVALNRREPPAAPVPPTSDASDAAAPDADALDTDRILELPARRSAASRGTSRPEEEQTPQPPRIARIVPTLPAMPRAPSRLHSVPGSDAAAPRRMVSLREAAAPYLARLATRHGSDGAKSTQGSEADTHEVPTISDNPRPSGKRQEAAPAAPVCPLCHGVGFVRLDLPVGDPSFGRAVPCECKEREIEERRRRELRWMSNLDPFASKTFETFDSSVINVQEAFEAARQFVEGTAAWKWLVLHGSYGCGKTHLAAAIAREWEKKSGDTICFSIVPDLLDHLRATFAPTSEITYDALFDRVRHVGLLVLDDLGAENGTAWATEKLFQIINYRYNYRMPTVITTNKDLLKHLDERMRSRLDDLSLVRWVSIKAGDYRKRSGRLQPPRNGNSSPPR